jgi:hypothetical protein
MWDWLFGSSGPQKADVPDVRTTPYPGADQVAAARAADVSYGDPSAAYAQPIVPYGPLSPNLPPQYSARLSQPQGHDATIDAFNADAIPSPGPISQSNADNLMQAYLGSRRSALASLGFDPHHMALPSQPVPGLTIGGQYTPGQDQIVSTGEYPSTSVHESMHRGIQALRDANMITPDMAKMSEEATVRAQMLRNFNPSVEAGRGSISDQQIDDGAYYNRQFPQMMDAYEQAAQRLYAQRHPGGPR